MNFYAVFCLLFTIVVACGDPGCATGGGGQLLTVAFNVADLLARKKMYFLLHVVREMFDQLRSFYCAAPVKCAKTNLIRTP